MSKRVFIGVGHGGSDPGASKNGIVEKNVNLDIALAMKTELEKYGVIVGMSRFKDENDDITEEIREANAFKPNIAIDVHTNAGGGKGFEVLVQTNKFAKYSNKLASSIEKEVKAIGQLSRGIKTRKNSNGTDYFGFLRQVNCPSIITECAFVDGDFSKIDTLEERKAFGKAYAKGVLNYFGISNNSNTTTTSEFKVKVTIDILNIRQQPDTNSKITGKITDKGIYTIVERKGKWGKLKSGVGWIFLEYTSKL